ncbi:response regulator transcription factor [Glaciimonas sp. PCH181]|uniref:response regulator n=1 Tax=Glaciimonas sp. PCH181 TaxID=2133943 RepID=UPI000D3C2F3E|nr:response regulator transcription factor [Glaciimonas sp. PCH181]PUA17780.1 DNA-binding response regulator [Glaciimonas sp. PCH181]
MRVLLVEDDRMIGEAIQMALRDASYTVDWAHDGNAALNATLATDHPASYDLMLLDLGLPQLDGVEVLRQLRQRGSTLPVLIVTARDAVDDRIRGLDLGADDYVVKPFEMGELLARMRALIRRQAGNATPLMTNGALSLDPTTREVTFENIVTRLSAREFALLHALLLRPGAILSRQELENRLYGWNEEVESNAVEFLIHSIRKKLGAASIKNVRGLGWMVAKQNDNMSQKN